jgi:UDP-galactopyranose mutase
MTAQTSEIAAEVDFREASRAVKCPSHYDLSRIVEIKGATGQQVPSATIIREYPQESGPGREPYSAIPMPDSKALYLKYTELAPAQKNVSFVSRLVIHYYYNIGQLVGMILAELDRFLSNG